MEYLIDVQLIEAIRSGETFAFDILFDRYWDKLYRAGISRLNDPDQVKDIIQEIFVKIWERRASLVINTSLENYLNGALKYAIISYFRLQKVKDKQLDEALNRMEVLQESVHNMSDYILLEQILEEAVNSMPETLKQVYLLRSANLSVKEIADKLGIADQTVKNYIAEVLRRLRVLVSKRYPEEYLLYITLILTQFTIY